MKCLSTGLGRFWLEEEPEVSWPARGFGPRRNSCDPQVNRSTLLALLAHLLIVGRGITAFHLDAAGVVSVLDDSDRVRRLSPDRDGLYDLASLDCVCHRCAPRDSRGDGMSERTRTDPAMTTPSPAQEMCGWPLHKACSCCRPAGHRGSCNCAYPESTPVNPPVLDSAGDDRQQPMSRR